MAMAKHPDRPIGAHSWTNPALAVHPRPGVYWGMKTFLVPVDFSPVSEAVINTAVSFARALAGKVVLLHAVQPPVIVSGEYALPVEVMQEAVTAGEQATQEKLARYEDVFRSAGLEPEALLRHGPPVQMILAEAKRVRADYIVMGSHGHGRLYDLLVGSTSAGVLKRCTCGVIIVPPEDKHG